jgi:hypothetical protein
MPSAVYNIPPGGSLILSPLKRQHLGSGSASCVDHNPAFDLQLSAPSAVRRAEKDIPTTTLTLHAYAQDRSLNV